MFILTQYLLKNFLSSHISDNSLPTYTVVIGLVVYALFYSYFLMYNRELLPFFNKIIIYVIGIDLLVSAFYNYNIQLQNTHLNDHPSHHLENLNNIEYNLIQDNIDDDTHDDEENDEENDEDDEEDDEEDDDNDTDHDDDGEVDDEIDELIDENNVIQEDNTFDELIDEQKEHYNSENKNETVLSNETTMVDLNNQNFNESLNKNLKFESNDASTNESVNTIFSKQISEQNVKKRGRPSKKN